MAGGEGVLHGGVTGALVPGASGVAGALVTVPAVKGRLLLFDGEMLHGVPRPACQSQLGLVIF